MSESWVDEYSELVRSWRAEIEAASADELPGIAAEALSEIGSSAKAADSDGIVGPAELAVVRPLMREYWSAVFSAWERHGLGRGGVPGFSTSSHAERTERVVLRHEVDDDEV